MARSSTPATTLHITARQGERTETRDVDLGPSVVDLPAGCWRLTLSWGDREDTVEVEYVAPR